MINKENNIFYFENQVFSIFYENIILHNNIILNNNMNKRKQSNTSDIDKKKNYNSDKSVTYQNTYNYGSLLFRQFITLGVVIIVGTGIVYSSKAYQGNNIPVDSKYFPYTNLKNPKFKDSGVQTNSINIFKTSDNKIYSTHIQFPIEENNKMINNSLLGYFRKIKNNNVYNLYIFTVLQDLLKTNLSFNGTLYKFLNSFFNESTNIFLGPLFFVVWCVLVFFINIINIIVSLIKNLNLLFSINENENNNNSLFGFLNFLNKMTDGGDDKPPKWKKGSMFSSITNIIIGFIYIYFIWLFTLLFGILIVFPIISLISIIYCFILPLYMKAKNVKNVDKPTDYNFKNALLDVLKYKSQVIMLIIALIIISATYNFFGSVLTVVSIVVFLIMFFFTPIFERYKLNIKDNLLPGAPTPVPYDDYGSDLVDEPEKSSDKEETLESSEKEEAGQEEAGQEEATAQEATGEESTGQEEAVKEEVAEEKNEEPPKDSKKKSSQRHKWFG